MDELHRHADALGAALLVHQAGRIGRYDILGAGAGVPGPKAEPGDALVLDLPVVPVRPLADYAIGGLS